MNYSLFNNKDTQQVIKVFTDVFAASEGAAEGQAIGELVTDLIATTATDDLIGCVATNDDDIVGCIFFSRFIVPNGQTAFMLSPVAVATNTQGTGVGQQLIAFGLDHLRTLGVELAFTYGDPNYYCKTGFRQITEDVVKAPYTLSQPIGWLVQALDGSAVPAMQGDTQCVPAFCDPQHW